jgi:hypothetical protein
MGLFSSLLNTAVKQVAKNADLSDIGKLIGGAAAANTVNTSGNAAGFSANNAASVRDDELYDALYTVAINGKCVTLPMDFDRFLAETGLVRSGDSTAYGCDVTDGYSLFSVGVKNNKVYDLHVYLSGVNSVDDGFDPSKTELVFPGGLTFNTVKAALPGMYPFKGKGKFEVNTYYDDREADVWTINPESNKPSVLVVCYKDLDKDIDFGGPADKPTIIYLFI